MPKIKFLFEVENELAFLFLFFLDKKLWIFVNNIIQNIYIPNYP